MEGCAATCQSGCYKDVDDESSPGSRSPSGCNSLCTTDLHNQNRPNVCTKCKAKVVFKVIDDQAATHCFDCFRSNTFGKFRSAVSSNTLITSSDNVLVAFSGGSSSRMALQFVHELHYKSQKDSDASRDKARSIFGVGVAFVDETTVFSASSYDTTNVIKEMELIVMKLTPPEKKFHHVPIEIVYADLADGKRRMKELLCNINDVTGRDDLLQHFRMLALQKVALDNGYTKLLLGSSASRIACHIISKTVKGQGYSLPADIQYIDSRWEVPVILPFRDCLARELKILCDVENLETIKMLEAPRSGINELVSSFVSFLQDENQSRESTIVRTASKLMPFRFNKIQKPEDVNDCLARQKCLKKPDNKHTGSTIDDSLCLICHSPLCDPDILNGDTLNDQPSIYHTFKAACCSSCRFQIIPADSSSLEHFYSNLPVSVVVRKNAHSRKSLRENIKDSLLSNSEDES